MPHFRPISAIFRKTQQLAVNHGCGMRHFCGETGATMHQSARSRRPFIRRRGLRRNAGAPLERRPLRYSACSLGNRGGEMDWRGEDRGDGSLMGFSGPAPQVRGASVVLRALRICDNGARRASRGREYRAVRHDCDAAAMRTLAEDEGAPPEAAVETGLGHSLGATRVGIRERLVRDCVWSQSGHLDRMTANACRALINPGR